MHAIFRGSWSLIFHSKRGRPHISMIPCKKSFVVSGLEFFLCSRIIALIWELSWAEIFWSARLFLRADFASPFEICRTFRDLLRTIKYYLSVVLRILWIDKCMPEIFVVLRRPNWGRRFLSATPTPFSCIGLHPTRLHCMGLVYVNWITCDRASERSHRE
jgi:hypothetical protein